MIVVIPLKENLMYVPLNFENDAKRKTLNDTGACANTMRADFYEEKRELLPNSLSQL